MLPSEDQFSDYHDSQAMLLAVLNANSLIDAGACDSNWLGEALMVEGV